MTEEVFRVEGYWRPRAEGARSCALRLAQMLDGLAEAHPAFANWNKQTGSRAAANKPAWATPPEIDELTAVFEKGRQYKDIPREPWPEMGYGVNVERARSSLRSVIDPPSWGYADWIPFPNTADLRLNAVVPDNADLISAAVLKQALLSLAAAWEPDHGNVVCWDYWQRLFGDRHYPTLRSGWMTYLAPQYASRIAPPSQAIVERVAGGGMLLLATPERFSMDNPQHLAVADAIQAALEPLQAMVARGRDAPLGERR